MLFLMFMAAYLSGMLLYFTIWKPLFSWFCEHVTISTRGWYGVYAGVFVVVQVLLQVWE